jgi:hypothetical protein
MIKPPQGKFLLMAGLAVIAAAAGYYALTAPDTRDAEEKLGDAVDELSNGADNAARQLKDRTPAEKLGDAAKDAGDGLKKAVERP